MIELSQVTKLYGTVIGVNDVSLALSPGAYGLLGPNGSGKSTLINLITGQIRPSLGAIRVLGANPWRNKRMLRRIGVCPEKNVLYDNVSALDWVGYLVELYGFSRREARRRAESALEQVGMTAAMKRPIGSYSLGMRQRTKLAQALAHDPELLVLDEPVHGLDPIGRREMTELLRGWIAGGRSLLLASHVLHEVEAVTRSFLLICGGRLLASGTADEIHALLADVPSNIRIRCDETSRLAERLIAAGAADSLSFEEQGAVVVVATRHPATIYSQLPGWIESDGIRVRELKSSDKSLQSLFDTLLRLRRGEAG